MDFVVPLDNGATIVDEALFAMNIDKLTEFGNISWTEYQDLVFKGEENFMSVGVLIISHDGIGPALLGTATLMLEGCPLQTRLLTTSRDCDPDQLMDDAIEQIKTLDTGDGVLVLTDLYGSTPSNIAQKLIAQRNVHVVSGLNLSMLIRILNYPQLPLLELSEKAVSGGKDGISWIRSEQ